MKNQINASNVTVNYSQYRFSHNKEPRGRGNWWFKVGNEEFSVWGSFSYAKWTAIQKAVEIQVREVTVLP